MLAVSSLILLGAALLLAFGFLKVIADVRQKALMSSRELFADHFERAKKFIDDPVSPPELASLLLDISKTVNEEAFGPAIINSLYSFEAKPRSAPDSKLANIFNSIEDLNKYRPDLAENFKKSIASGFLAAAFLQVAREVSPFRAFRESQEARQAKRAKQPDDVVAQALRAVQGFGHPTAAC